MFAGTTILDTIKYCRIPLSYLNPQIEHNTGIVTDTLNWIPITGTFVASGNEKYVVLGNFRSNSATPTMVINPTHLPNLVCDVYIDDVSLVDIDLPAFAGKDTNIVTGDSVFIGREPDVGIDYACQWYQLPNDTVPIDTVAGLWVKPITKTTYVVKQQLWCSGVKWDTVTVHFNTVRIADFASMAVRIIPNPTTGQFELCGLVQGEDYTLRILDIGGRRVYNRTFPGSEECINVSTDLPKGIYQVVCDNGVEVYNERLIIHAD